MEKHEEGATSQGPLRLSEAGAGSRKITHTQEEAACEAFA